MANDDRATSSVGGLELAPGVVVPEAAVQLVFVRSSGPGGQNVNKRSTKAQLRVDLLVLARYIPADVMERLKTLVGATRLTLAGELLVEDDQSRSQAMNREACFARLRQWLITAAVKPKRRFKTKPSRGSKERRLESKRIHAAHKQRRSGSIGE